MSPHLHTSIFIETPSLEGLPTKAKEDRSSHEMRLFPRWTSTQYFLVSEKLSLLFLLLLSLLLYYYYYYYYHYHYYYIIIIIIIIITIIIILLLLLLSLLLLIYLKLTLKTYKLFIALRIANFNNHFINVNEAMKPHFIFPKQK